MNPISAHSPIASGGGGAVGPAGPPGADGAATKWHITANTTVTSDTCYIVSGSLEIDNGIVLTVNNGGVVEIL